MSDSHGERIIANEMRRDNGAIPQLDESFSVVLDTFNDQRSGFLFVTNPLGALMDGSFTSEKEYNGNYDPIWSPKTTRSETGWNVEIEIPFKSLRYASAGDQVWGINMRRVVRWKNEVLHLTPISALYGMSGVRRLTAAATLVGLRTPAVSKNLELKPYAVSKVATDRLARPATSNDVDATIGFDAKYGLTRAVIADFTYNTDFAQVEDDQQQVNLTRFSLFYPEKRDFFLEGQGVFNFGGGADTTDLPVLFFSRRIGLENGLAVPIRAGGRVTGKAGKFMVGALLIRTDESAAAGTTATSFQAARVRRDFLRRGSIGVLATYRNPSGGTENLALGADANMGFGLATINAYYARTHTPGRSGQTASYYGQLDYNGDRYGVTLEHLTVEPGFNPEIGFLRRRDFRKEYGYARYSPAAEALAGGAELYNEASLSYITDAANHLQSRSRWSASKETSSAATASRPASSATTSSFRSRSLCAPPSSSPSAPTRSRAARCPTHSARFISCAAQSAPPRGPFWGNEAHRELQRREAAARQGAGVRADHFRELGRPAVGQLPGRFDLKSSDLFLLPPLRSGGARPVQFDGALVVLEYSLPLAVVPGSDFFVVYNDARSTLVPDRLTELQGRTLLVKMTRLFRY